MKSSWIGFVLCLGLVVTPMFGQSRMASGITLEEAIHELQVQGLNIIYSTDVVKPEMKLAGKPQATIPRDILNEILVPFNLKVRTGPRKTLLIVQDKPPEPPKKDPSDPPPELKSPKEFVVVPYVSIDFSARDGKHQFVTNLKPEDLVVKEDGKPLRIDHFYGPGASKFDESGIPLTVLFLMDASRSMTPGEDEAIASGFVKQAALRLADELRPGDQAMVMEFNENSWVAGQMTADLGATRQTLLDYKIVPGWTGLLDALQNALRVMEAFSGRKMIILCSDGKDNASHHSTLDNLLLTVEASDATILAVGPKFRGYIAQKGRKLIEKVAEESGGYAFFPENNDEVESMLVEARKAMRSQYAIGYTPPNPHRRGWRQVEIQCKVGGVRLRYRKSYLF